MRLLLLLILILFLSIEVPAQNISGKWQGNYSGVMTIVMRPQQLIVAIEVISDTIVKGSSHLYYNSGAYEHYNITGYYRPEDSTIFFSEDGIIGKSFNETCLGDYSMKLSIKGNMMRFEGKWKDNSDEFILFRCPSSGVWLEKKLPENPVVKKRAEKDQNLSRNISIQQLIEIDTDEKDSIKIELVDNAQIDHDVVSIYLNDSLVLHKHTLTATPATFYLSVNKEMATCRLKMAAESMGSIPPCTALMIVSTKRNRYQVTLSSNFGNNGTLELFLKDQ